MWASESGTDSNAVGIQIGEDDSNLSSAFLKLHNSFIKANVWVLQSGGTGMLVYGEIKYSLVNLRSRK